MVTAMMGEVMVRAFQYSEHCVSEIRTERTRFRPILAALLATTALCGTATAQELPTGGNVVAGSAAIGAPSGGTMVVNQSSDRAVLQWNTFSIGSGATVRFNQPGPGSAVLNRVTGALPSRINGNLSANGQVFLANPNGVVVGPGGRVEASGFVASTLDINNGDFMERRLRFTGNGASAAVENHGSIRIGRGGYAALLGGRISNSGVVQVPLGRVGFAAGEMVTLDLSGDRFLQVAVPSMDDGNSDALIRSTGRVSANGGVVEMRAATARHAARHAINLDGVVEARSVSGRNGSITLGGGTGGSVRVKSRVSTSAPEKTGPEAPRSTGGRIEITGADIALEGAVLDASGAGGGGDIRVGGDVRGGGNLPRAMVTTADAQTQILADATESGHGGTIVLWSHGFSGFEGRISAQGRGAGDGGFAEVSGIGRLSFGGLVDLTAEDGRTGTLLLDPYDIIISMAETSAESGFDDFVLLDDSFLFATSGFRTFVPGDAPSTLNVGELTDALAGSNVTVATGGDDSPGSQDGNITVNAPISWTSANTLELEAAADIVINQPITAANGGLWVDAGDTITAGTAGAIDVAEFGLRGGVWNQNQANQGFALPGFEADNFTISGSSLFIRALSGNGSGGAPYRIADVYGLQGMNLSTWDGLNSLSFSLSNNIDASGTENWNPDEAGGLGGFRPIFGSEGAAYSGTFDGNGFTISNLFVNSAGNAGLFETIGSGAVVRDVTLSGAEVSGTGNVGAIAGANRGRIEDVIVASSSVEGFADNDTFGGLRVGGIVGWNENGAVVTQTEFSGSVQGEADGRDIPGLFRVNVGGIAGENDGAISDTGTSGTVVAGAVSTDDAGSDNNEASVHVGGLVGTNDATITRSMSSATVTGDGFIELLVSSGEGDPFVNTFGFDASFDVGGLVGQNSASISNSYATGDASANVATSSDIGGLVGFNPGIIENSFATGDVTNTDADDSDTRFNQRAGGLVGVNRGSIETAYATGTVRNIGGNRIGVGGLLGFSSSAGTVTDAYAHGDVSSTGADTVEIGGLIGRNEGDATRTYSTGNVPSAFSTGAGGLIGVNSGNVQFSFWDIDSSGRTTSEGGTGLPTTSFQSTEFFFSETGFESATWNSQTVWAPGDTGFYPELYALSPVILAEADDTTATYGDEVTPSGEIFGGPETYLFDDPGDAIDEDDVFVVNGFTGDTGTFVITAVDSVESDQGVTYRVINRDGELEVAQRAVTVTALGADKTYGELTELGFDPSELVSGGTVFADPKSEGEPEDASVGSYDINISSVTIFDDGVDVTPNYQITIIDSDDDGSIKLEVLPREVTLIANAATKTYGDTSFGQPGGGNLTYGFDPDQFADGDEPTALPTSLGTEADANVGVYDIVIDAGSVIIMDDGVDVTSNYEIAPVGNFLTVTPAPLTITALDQKKTFGQTVTFTGNEVDADGLVLGQQIGSVALKSDGTAADAAVSDTPYVIEAGDPVVIPYNGANASGNYDITFVDGALTVTRLPDQQRPPLPVDNIPDLQTDTTVDGLPNPGLSDEQQANFLPAAFGATETSPEIAAAEETFGVVGSVSDTLQFASQSCRQQGSDTVGYLECLVSALDEFASAMDALRSDLPPELRSIAGIIVDLRNEIEGARATAEIRLQSAGSEAERAAIQREAIDDTRAALQSAAAEITQAISLVRADDPELASIQIETGNVIVDALFILDTDLARATEL